MEWESGKEAQQFFFVFLCLRILTFHSIRFNESCFEPWTELKSLIITELNTLLLSHKASTTL
jgi:hypothetical protein